MLRWTEELLAPLRDQPERLVSLALEQARTIQSLQEQLAAATAQAAELLEQLRQKNQRLLELETQLEEARRTAARPAAPFRRQEEERAVAPKRPGRPAGHPGCYRPRPASVDEEMVVPLSGCPHCGGPVTDAQEVEQIIEELPEVRPRVTRLRTWCAHCPRCAREVRSTHPLQVSEATGAAGVQLGPRALAVAAQLNKAHGLTTRRTCAVLKDLFGLQLSPGGLVQALARVSTRLQPRYETLLSEVRAAPVLHADETSWWVGGPGWWLWVFTHAQLTVYVVVDNRARVTLTDTVGADFAGVRVSDCLAPYDDATPRQHKCYAHHHRAIAEAQKAHPQGGTPYLSDVRALLRAAQALKKVQPELPPADRAVRRTALDHAAAALLGVARGDPHEERVRARLDKQRDHLFTFLDHDGVDATNNLAERQLRPAVIARKLSCGNKTPAGAQTWQVLTSLAATCHQRAESFLQLVACSVTLQGR